MVNEMEHKYQNGKIVIEAKLYERTLYNVSNQQVSVIFDGKGATVSYALANEKEFFQEGCLSLFRNGVPVDIYTPKRVEMLGRCQTIFLELGDARLTIKQFLHPVLNGVFVFYHWQGSSENDMLELGMTLRASGLYDEQFAFCASKPFTYVADNMAFYGKLTGEESCQVFFSFGNKSQVDTKKIEKNFQQYAQEMEQEIADVKVPKGLTEEEKALFYSSFFCALQNYKEKGDYKGFMAGHRYLLPMRTYYRDSYYTVLPMYNGHEEKVRNQVITLAKGIQENGDCPSAVKSDYSQWWGNHYDSPSFFIMMLYDYVNFTKDTGLLDMQVNGETVLKIAQKVLEKLSSYADDTGLLYKDGKYNKRDWADEINRWGYVTYDEVLYARAHYCLSELLKMHGEEADAKEYVFRYEKIKNAINSLLWDEKKGYYVNFYNAEYTEDNLSVDTVFAVIFGIADEEKSIRMLKNMEALLETRNNTEQKAGDYGVMCVYPFYKNIQSTCHKSAQPYYYHNGANWPYWSAVYAYAKRKFGMEYHYALESWFDYNVKRGNYTPIEFFSPPQADGSLLQAWSGAAAFVLDEELSMHFWD